MKIGNNLWRNIWWRYNDLANCDLLIRKKKTKTKTRWGIRARENTNNCHPIQAENAQRSHWWFIHEPETCTHKHTHTNGTKRDWIRPRVCVLTALSRRHHVPTYVCNTDDQNNKSGWPLRPRDDLSLWICSETVTHQSQTWTRQPNCMWWK